MTIICRKRDNDVLEIRVSGPVSVELFKQMVRRGMNVWDRAPAEMKEFGDIVDHGYALQNYYAQEGTPSDSPKQPIINLPSVEVVIDPLKQPE